MKTKIESDFIKPIIVSASKSAYLFQFVLTISATLSIASITVAFGWTSPTLPILLGPNSPLPITPDESSWIVSFITIGALIAPFPTAWANDKFGRKLTLIMTVVPLILCWILVLTAKSVISLYFSRILAGISRGMVYSVLPIYLGEIASDRIRGSIGTLITVMAKVGILYAYTIGPYVSITLMAWLAMIPIVLFLLTFIWMPESPYFLLDKNKHEKAIKALILLRKLNENDIKPELSRMTIAIEKSKENHGTFKELIKSGNRRSLIIILGLGASQILCGSQAIIAYSEKIFTAMGSELGGSESTIILGVVQLIGSAFSSTIIDHWGRRPLLLLSTGGVALANTIIGIYFLIIRFVIISSSISWIPMLSLMFFVISFSIGMSTIPFIILGEIFPKNIKSIAAACYTAFSAILSFGVHKLFQIVTDNLGPDYTFLGFAAITIFFVCFIFMLLPETKGKSLDTILDEINLKNEIKNDIKSDS